MINNPKIAFFGSSNFSVICLEELKTFGILPDIIITTPNAPTGRGLQITATPVKIWAQENGIECLTPEKLDSAFALKLSAFNFQLFLVASYGKIIPKAVIDFPKYKTLNIHPSRLPKYRGPSPLQEQILSDEKNIGVTIILLDEKVDHGPIIAQKEIILKNWPVNFETLEKSTAEEGARLFAKILPDWLAGKITAEEQKHAEATFTKKVNKEDGLIDIETADPYKNWLKIQAYSTWPNVFFFIQKGNKKIRVIIKDADYKNNILTIKKVRPESKSEMPYEDFLRGLK